MYFKEHRHGWQFWKVKPKFFKFVNNSPASIFYNQSHPSQCIASQAARQCTEGKQTIILSLVIDLKVMLYFAKNGK